MREGGGIIHLPGSQQSGWWVVPGAAGLPSPLSSPHPQFFFICCLLLLRKPPYFILLILFPAPWVRVCAHGVGQGSIQEGIGGGRGGWRFVLVMVALRGGRSGPTGRVLPCGFFWPVSCQENKKGARGALVVAGGSGCCSYSMLGDRTELMLCDGHGGGVQLWVGSAPMYGT